MEITYQRTMRQSFMVIIAETDMPGYHLDMFRRNRIGYFLEFDVAMADGRTEYWYDITGRQAFEEYLKGNKLDGDFFKMFMAALKGCVENVESFLLDEDYIMLEPEMIYVGAGGEEVYFCYGILAQEPLHRQLRRFMEYLLTKLDHSERSAVELGYLVYQKTLEPNFTMEDIWEILRREDVWSKKEERSLPEKQEDVPAKETEEKIVQIRENGERMLWRERAAAFIREQRESIIKKLPPAGAFKRGEGKKEYQVVFAPEDFKEEMSGDTVFLGAEGEEPVGGILRFLGEECGRDIFLDQKSATVGSGKDADIQIQVKSVSRMHARITREGHVCYLEDLNSRNGTWVNGRLLNYKEKVEILPEDTVEFAGERYCFGIHRG